LFGLVYVHTSTAQVNKGKNKPKPKKIPIITNTSTIVPPDTLAILDSVEFDPMDTVIMRVSKSAITKKVVYNAKDSMPYDAENNIFYLYNEASVIQDDLDLKANFIEIDIGKNLMTAKGTTDTAGKITGKPVFNQGGTEYKADLIKYNIKSKKGYLSEFRTKEGEGYIQGEEVVKSADNTFGVDDAKYTTCNLEHPHYYIGADKIKVIPEKKIITGPANLIIEDVRTPLFLPFGIFSIKRGQASGVIVPSYGNARDRGYFLRDGGYYFGLGEKADYTIKGSFYANTSWEIKNGLRYNNRYQYGGNLQFSYADNKLGEITDVDYQRLKNFLFTWTHNSDAKARPGTTFAANVNVASINNAGSSYLQLNSYNPNNIVTNQLNSTINFGKSLKGGKYNFATTASMSQNTQTRDMVVSFPDFTFNVSSFNPFLAKRKVAPDKWYENITINYRSTFKNRVNTKDSILFQPFTRAEFVNFLDTAASFGVFHEAPIQTSFKVLKFYTLSASVTLNEYWYLKTVTKEIRDGSIVTNNVDGFERAFTYTPRVGLTTRIYGLKNFRKGKIAAVRHVINPTVDFTYSPDYADSRFGYYKSITDPTGREIKYSIFERGINLGPSLGQQGNIGFGVDNNLELKVRRGKDTAQKEEKVQIFESFSVTSSYNLLADSLHLNIFRINARTRLFKNISVNGIVAVDPYENRITELNGFKTVNRFNNFYATNQRQLGIITEGNLGIGATFNKDSFKKLTSKKESDEAELKYINDSPEDYYNFNIPWNLSVNYTIQYRKFQSLNAPNLSDFFQTVNVSGDINLTSNWKVGYTSGYDIKNKELTFTSIDFIRLLHCWEFKLNWIPIGLRQSFLFTINVKSSLLQDLRTTRRRDWFDKRI